MQIAVELRERAERSEAEVRCRAKREQLAGFKDVCLKDKARIAEAEVCAHT